MSPEVAASKGGNSMVASSFLYGHKHEKTIQHHILYSYFLSFSSAQCHCNRKYLAPRLTLCNLG